VRIKRLELTNFMAFDHVTLDELPDGIVLVSPNGGGKSAILHAIACAEYLATKPGGVSRGGGRRVVPWPEHLPAPVKLGTAAAEVSIVLEASEEETRHLAGERSTAAVGSAHYRIEDGRDIVAHGFEGCAAELLRAHSPYVGLGLVDHIRPIRFHGRQSVGDLSQQLSDQRTTSVWNAFPQGWQQQDKFSQFKSFVAAVELTDGTRRRETGEDHDSLQGLRETFSRFFPPKRLVGAEMSPGGPVDIVVAGASGRHSTDDLSDGEKELLQVLAHLYRFRELANVVLWDTPELHLNAALEARLYDALQSVAPRNQYWIATHSLEFINTVPLDQIFVIRSQGAAARVERASEPERASRVRIYRELGAQVGLQLVSTVVVFCEGKDAESDKRILERLLRDDLPNATFVASGGCNAIGSAVTRLDRLLEKATTNGDFLAVVDRDFRSEEEALKVETDSNGRLFVWRAHEIENVLLDPRVLYLTLEHHDLCGGLSTPEEVREALRESARSLQEWIAATWVQDDLTEGLVPPVRRIIRDNPRQALMDSVRAATDQVAKVPQGPALEQRVDRKVEDIERALKTTDQWLKMLPGKEILAEFLQRHTKGKLTRETYLPSATGIVKGQRLQLDEIERLKETIRKVAASARQTGDRNR